jgi:hypothetical protein
MKNLEEALKSLKGQNVSFFLKDTRITGEIVDVGEDFVQVKGQDGAPMFIPFHALLYCGKPTETQAFKMQ